MDNCTYHLQTINQKVFHFVYGCALRDAILRGSFKGKNKEWIGELDQPKNIVRNYIDQLLGFTFDSQTAHDAFFLDAANALCKEINRHRPAEAEDVFSFGNAQKLLNIAVKHIYSFCYYDPKLRDAFRYCHCPLDQIMLEKIWKQYPDNTKRRAALGKHQEFFTAWGSEGTEDGRQPDLTCLPERYRKFQAAVKDLIGEGDIYPVEFDYLFWK